MHASLITHIWLTFVVFWICEGSFGFGFQNSFCISLNRFYLIKCFVDDNRAVLSKIKVRKKKEAIKEYNSILLKFIKATPDNKLIK